MEMVIPATDGGTLEEEPKKFSCLIGFVPKLPFCDFRSLAVCKTFHMWLEPVKCPERREEKKKNQNFCWCAVR